VLDNVIEDNLVVVERDVLVVVLCKYILLVLIRHTIMSTLLILLEVVWIEMSCEKKGGWHRGWAYKHQKLSKGHFSKNFSYCIHFTS